MNHFTEYENWHLFFKLIVSSETITLVLLFQKPLNENCNIVFWKMSLDFLKLGFHGKEQYLNYLGFRGKPHRVVLA